MYKITSNDIPIFFSFCIYGNKPIYYEGLLRNLDIIANINKPKPPHVLIGHGADILPEYKEKYESYPFVKLIKIADEFSESTMCSRLLQLDTLPRPAYVFCRDADSRISPRDIWCIQSFINSQRKLHVIRDHYYHKQKIMGGTCGFLLEESTMNFTELFRKSMIEFANLNKAYGLDEYFLSNMIYTKFTPQEIWINSNCIGHIGEQINKIDLPQKDDTDFIGNVYNPDETAHFTYSNYILLHHLEWLVSNQQWELILLNIPIVLNNTEQSQKYRVVQIQINALLKTKNLNACLDIFKDTSQINEHIISEFDNIIQLAIELNQKHRTITFFLDIAIKCENIDWCLNICEQYEFLTIDENTMIETNKVFDLALHLGYNIVATSNIKRKPVENEIVICYGQFPHSLECLPSTTRIVYRHPIYFSNVNHTIVEYNDCWEQISVIYILNLEHRQDRYYSILVELCRVQAPLNRIFHYKAQKSGDSSQDIYIGATKNHLDVVGDFIFSGTKYCLILEDDITFISDINHIFKSLTDFFSNPPEFDVCFLAYSKMGLVKKHNDLLSLSYQQCTTSSAYLLNNTTAPLVKYCFKTGVDEMKKGNSPNIYCCDRYWAILQHRNNMFLFKRKLAFQSITHSDIKNNINYAFD
jgi:hypothetical protein